MEDHWSLSIRVSAGINLQKSLLICADCLLSMEVNFLIATHYQMLIALDANEFLAAKKDAWSLSKVVRTPGSEFKHDTDQSPWNPRDLFSSMQMRQSVSIIGGIISKGLDHNWLSLVICIQCRHAFVAVRDWTCVQKKWIISKDVFLREAVIYVLADFVR